MGGKKQSSGRGRRDPFAGFFDDDDDDFFGGSMMGPSMFGRGGGFGGHDDFFGGGMGGFSSMSSGMQMGGMGGGQATSISTSTVIQNGKKITR